MKSKSMIDMSKANSMYLIGLGVLTVASLLMNNFPVLSPSRYFVIYFKREVLTLLFAAGGLAGAFAIARHLARARTPWLIPQSQVTISYAAFFICTLAAIVVSR